MSRLKGHPGTKRLYVDVPGGQINILATTEEAPRSTPIVLLHPTASSSATFIKVMHALGGDYRVFAPDSPGFGGSDRLEGQVSVPAMASVLVEAMRGLGLDRIHLYGNHTGAVIAAWIAGHHPEMVERMILSGPPLLTDERRAQMIAAMVPAVIEEDGRHLVRLWDRYRGFAVSAGLDVPRREVALHLIAAEPEATYLAVLNEDLPNLYRAIGCPTLVTSGTHDTLRPGSDGVVDLIPESTFELIPNAGNFVVDEAPEAVVAQIRSWFG